MFLPVNLNCHSRVSEKNVAVTYGGFWAAAPCHPVASLWKGGCHSASRAPLCLRITGIPILFLIFLLFVKSMLWFDFFHFITKIFRVDKLYCEHLSMHHTFNVWQKSLLQSENPSVLLVVACARSISLACASHPHLVCPSSGVLPAQTPLQCWQVFCQNWAVGVLFDGENGALCCWGQARGAGRWSYRPER